MSGMIPRGSVPGAGSYGSQHRAGARREFAPGFRIPVS